MTIPKVIQDINNDNLQKRWAKTQAECPHPLLERRRCISKDCEVMCGICKLGFPGESPEGLEYPKGGVKSVDKGVLYRAYGERMNTFYAVSKAAPDLIIPFKDGWSQIIIGDFCRRFDLPIKVEIYGGNLEGVETCEAEEEFNYEEILNGWTLCYDTDGTDDPPTAWTMEW